MGIGEQNVWNQGGNAGNWGGGGDEGNQGENLRIGVEIMKSHFNYQYLIRMTLLALVWR